MAGLLDAFNDPQFQRGLLMMAAGQPMSEQARAGLLSYVDNQENAKMQREYMGMQMEGQKAQIEANRAKAALTQRQADFDQQLFSGLMGGGVGGGQPQAPIGSSGASGAAPPNARGAGFISSLTPDQLAALKIRGHDLTEQWKLMQPDMQVTNGYAYDKRNLQPGFMPSLQTTADGKSTMTQIGPNGMPVVSAPQGALGTYGAYKGIDANIAAQNDLIQNYNPETGRMEFGTRAQAVRAANGQPAPMAGGSGNIQSPGYAGGSREAANAETLAILDRELKNPNLPDADRAAILRERARVASQTPGAMAAGPSAMEQAQQEANRVLGVKRAENQAEAEKNAPKTLKQQQASIDQADRMLLKTDQALQKVSAWTAGAGASLAAIPGTSARDLQADIGTIKANLGFEQLQAMREASPTGGALGGVAVEELKALQSAVASLDQTQSPDQLRRSIGEIRQRYSTVLSIIKGTNPDALKGRESSNQSGVSQTGAGKSFSDYGYGNAQEMLQDARNAIMRNPGARAEVNRRLKEAGLSLNSGSW